MSQASSIRMRSALAALALAILVAGCSDEAGEPTAVVPKVDVCHTGTLKAAITAVPEADVAAHIAHGDYFTSLQVNRDATPSTDGIHFTRLTDALSALRTGRLARNELVSAGCRITITAAAGSYNAEQFPLVVDVPDITLRGALAMNIDNDGRAVGNSLTGQESILEPSAPLTVVAAASTPIILVNAHPTGSAGNGFTVEGFVFRSGHDPAVDAGGQGVFSMRATGLTIQRNRFEGGFTESIDLRASSGEVLQNFLSGTAGTCDVCLAAPGKYRAVGNRLMAGGVPGITTSAVVGLVNPAGVEPLTLPATAEVWSDVLNNEVRDHKRIPVGAGIRVEAIGTGAPNVHNIVHSNISNNLLVGNRFGILIHGGFPVNGTDMKGDVDVSLSRNTIEQSCQAKLFVALTRHSMALGINTFPWLRNSTFNVNLGGNIDWNEAWYGNPAGLGNTLMVDGTVMPNGIKQAYSATTCPAT